MANWESCFKPLNPLLKWFNTILIICKYFLNIWNLYHFINVVSSWIEWNFKYILGRYLLGRPHLKINFTGRLKLHSITESCSLSSYTPVNQKDYLNNFWILSSSSDFKNISTLSAYFCQTIFLSASNVSTEWFSY